MIKRTWVTKRVASWPEGYKECKKCGRLLPYESFHKHSKCVGGVNTVCKECRVPLSKDSWRNTSELNRILQRLRSRSYARGIECDVTLCDLKNIPDVCPVFNTPFIKGHPDYGLSVDRIDPSKGYIKGNLQYMSNKANRMKSDATSEELLAFAKWALGSCEIVGI